MLTDHLRVDFKPSIFMNPIGLVEFKPGGIVSGLGVAVSLVK